jgi:predicted peptidase
MNRLRWCAALLSVIVLLPAACTPNTRPTLEPKASVKTGQYAQAYTAPGAAAPSIKYLLSIPEDYATKGPWPVILFLHGSGERGDNLDAVKTHGPPKLIAAGRKVPAIVISPQCPANTTWVDHTKTLEALLDQVQARYEVDPQRIYLTGLSMGGTGAWVLANDQPGRFAAVVPICGRKPKTTLDMAALKNVPIWVFHGARDGTVPAQDSKDLVEALKNAGSSVRFTLYPDLEHDSWTSTYADESLWTWLLAQRRR